jgi:hypothetical protein
VADQTILEEAAELVAGPRKALYGKPSENWGKTAKVWSVILGIEVTAEQAVLCMIGAKLVREAHKPKRDNRVDICGYTEVLDQIISPP